MEVRDKVIKQIPIWERPWYQYAEKQERSRFILQFDALDRKMAVSVDQSKSTVIQLNHNNAVAKATTTAAVSPFNLELGQFSPLHIK